jgi:hypothetical protein
MGEKHQMAWGTSEGPHIQFLRENFPTMSTRELAAAFNERFGASVSESAIGFQLYRFRILKKPETAEERERA